MFPNAYKYVLEIAKYRNMSKAAYSLCISQPALTKYINRLEQHLNVKLLNRSKSPITLTIQGEAFIRKAETILLLENELILEIQNNSSCRGTLAFGIPFEMGNLILPYILPEVKLRYPNLTIEVVEGSNSFLLTELSKGNIDIVVASKSVYPNNVKAEFLDKDPIILNIPLNNPITKSFDLSMNSPLTPYYMNPFLIKFADFIIISSQHGMGILARHFFQKHHINPHIVYELDKNETALRVASSGLGMCFSPMRTPLRIKLIKPMAYFSIENPIFCRKRLIYYRNDRPLTALSTFFIKFLKSIMQREEELQPFAYQLVHQPIFSDKHTMGKT